VPAVSAKRVGPAGLGCGGLIRRRGAAGFRVRRQRWPARAGGKLGEPLTPEVAGSTLVDLVRADPATIAPGYLLTAAGLQKVP
jgi:hypothetical protein